MVGGCAVSVTLDGVITTAALLNLGLLLSLNFRSKAAQEDILWGQAELQHKMEELNKKGT